MIKLTTEWHKATMARAVPGAYWNPDAKAWVLDEATPRGAAVALKLFPHLSVTHPELVELRAELLRDVRPFDTATGWVKANKAKLKLPAIRGILRDLGWKLHPFQEIDLAYAAAVLREHKAFYMGWERGLGKTLGTCCLIEELGAKATLVVAPNTAKDSVWGEELRRFCPDHELVILGNSKAQRARALGQVEVLHTQGIPFVLIVHYEALAIIAGKTKTPRGKVTIGDGWARLGITWDLMVTDEDHRLSNTEAQMYKAARKVPRDMLLILSGSIIQNHLEELYSPHRRAFPDRYRSKWRDWNDRFLDYVENGWGKVCVGVKEDQVPALRNELGVWMVYRRKEDELELPPKTYVSRRIELSPAQRKAYDELRAHCLAELASGEKVKAQEGIAMMGKLRQVATGLGMVSDELTDSSKLDAAIEDIMDAPDSDFVVFSWYKAPVRELAERLEAKGVECFCVTGDVAHKVRADYIARFQAGERRVFIGTLSTLGESVNLQRANQVIRLDRSWNPALNVQAEDRVFRQGQKRNVTITDYIAKDTVDELNVLPTLANKEAIRAAILGGA